MEHAAPLLTVAIPTFNRAAYLETCLAAVVPQARSAGGKVEVLVLDNASSDTTPEIAKAAQAQWPSLAYVRNEANVGSDSNIAQSFIRARGRHVWVLGDDDVALDGTVAWLVETLGARQPGLVCLRPYGFNRDFRTEMPASRGRVVEYGSFAGFLARASSHIALISAVVVDKSLIPDIDPRSFCGTSLVQVGVYLAAGMRSERFVYSEPYRVAYKRLNTNFDFSKIFVENLSAILERSRPAGLKDEAVRALERSMLLRYFPYHVWRLRLDRATDLAIDRARFEARYGRDALYRVLIAPIFALPRPLALAWGAFWIFAGRTLAGDLRRGLSFSFSRLRERYQRA